jgi:hypothetical protein
MRLTSPRSNSPWMAALIEPISACWKEASAAQPSGRSSNCPDAQGGAVGDSEEDGGSTGDERKTARKRAPFASKAR